MPKEPITAPSQPPFDTVDVDLLRRFVPLDGLNRKSLGYLCKHTKIVPLKEGDILFEPGDRSPFTYYLLSGAMSLQDVKGEVLVLQAGTERAGYAVSNLLPRQFRAMALAAHTSMLRILRDPMEKEVAWGQLSGGKDAPDNDWKISLLRTPLFTRLPMANVQELFETMQEVPCATGDVIIRQGGPGDYFYLIRSGACRVERSVEGRRITLGTLGVADAFGDEALVSDKPRNATVIADQDGLLMRLARDDFTRLMQAPLLKRVTLDVTRQAITTGKAVLLDVRMEEEFTENRLPDAINVPLFLLHLKLQSLNKGLKYVVYCDNSNRSDAAAFLMTRKGFDAYVLEDAGSALGAVAP